MRTMPLAWKTLRDLRGATIAVGATTFLMAVFIVAVFPSYGKQLAEIDFPAMYDAFFGEAPISSPEGFTSAEFFSWMPLLTITIAIIGGTGAIAGEESAGTLDALLALPVRRRDVLLAKALGNALAITIASLVAYPGFVVTALFVDFPIDWTNLAFATIGMLPISFLYLAIALWGSAALPTRGQASIVAIGAVVVPYILNTLGAAVTALDTIRKFSPFYWSDGSRVLVHGFQWDRTAGMLALALLVLFAALRAVERRDIGTHGGWSLPWQRHPRPDDAKPAAVPAPGGTHAT